MRRDNNDGIEECDDEPSILIGGRRNNNIVVVLLCLLAASSLLIGVGIGAADRWTQGRGGVSVATNNLDVAFNKVTNKADAGQQQEEEASEARTTTSSTTAASSLYSPYCRRKLDLPVSQPYNTQIDIHGQHMIIVTRETQTTNVHVIFYTRNNSNEVSSSNSSNTWNYAKDNHFVLD
jgi:hypothetical protein